MTMRMMMRMILANILTKSSRKFFFSIEENTKAVQNQFGPTKDRHLCETRLELFVRVSGTDIQSRQILHDKKLGSLTKFRQI